MDVQAWQVAAAFAVPVLGFLGAFLARDRDPALYRKLKHASTALKEVPAESAAAESLDRLVVQQAEILLDKERAASRRTFKPINLFLTLIIGLLVSAVLYALILWITATWGTPWVWISVPVTVVLAFASLLLMAAAVSTIYQAEDSDVKQRKAGRQQ